ncbi:spore coat protein YlbD [Evansella sp. AB-P1]|uniref:spore coat protein YlbD n=1 Tax=Evansella sp. AB-P1 TaxID=3037653 RepID=UPI00241ECAA3|nr:spore coat protein YlbD [Evansella sp. AB-P1]MDG5788319.1 spore coat protein YlbD [Evansella sp. AB-P1]
MSKSLHPDVKKFKAFVKNNPHVLKGVKDGDKTLQDLFEEWLLFGEEDDIWETYRNEEVEEEAEEEAEEETNEDDQEEKDKSSKDKKSNLSYQDMLAMLKKLNFNDLQQHLSQFSGVLVSVQELLSQFKQNDDQTPPSNNNEQQQSNTPFSFYDD